MKTLTRFSALLTLLIILLTSAAFAETEPETPYLLLEAWTGNWDEACPGMWDSMCWDISSDGSYVFTTYYIPDCDKQYDPISHTGILTPEEFERLAAAADSEGEWMDPAVDSEACDGQWWQIEMYDENGNVIRTTGKGGYIYGQERVETIISLLPCRDLELLIEIENAYYPW